MGFLGVFDFVVFGFKWRNNYVIVIKLLGVFFLASLVFCRRNFRVFDSCLSFV